MILHRALKAHLFASNGRVDGERPRFTGLVISGPVRTPKIHTASQARASGNPWVLLDLDGRMSICSDAWVLGFLGGRVAESLCSSRKCCPMRGASVHDPPCLAGHRRYLGYFTSFAKDIG